MIEGVSNKDLYQIINRALSQCVGFSNNPVNTEINIFAKKYQERLETKPQLDMFEEKVVVPSEIKEAKKFLDNLEIYRLATDIDSKDDFIPENVYRQLMVGLDKYKDIISKENQTVRDIIKKSAWRNLPEYKDARMLEEYIADAERIYRTKPKNKYDELGIEECARSAYYFLKKVLKGDEVKNAKPCQQKIELYKKSIKLVDCLTPKQYRRTFKFTLKRDLNDNLHNCAAALTDEYADVAEEAKTESQRFSKAIVNAMDYSAARYGEQNKLK